MGSKFSVKIMLLTLCTGIVLGCSSTKPHLGESMTQSSPKEGMTVTQADSRRLLPNGKIAGEDAALVQVEATVDMINYGTREFALSSGNGDPLTLIAGPEIRNFNQIQAGDKVMAEYLLAMAFEVRPPTAEELAASGKIVGMSARTKLGEKPGAGAMSTGIKVATVESIDMKNHTVKLKDPKTGSSALIKAKYPENLAFVKQGDSVVITAVEGFATSVHQVR